MTLTTSFVFSTDRYPAGTSVSLYAASSVEERAVRDQPPGGQAVLQTVTTAADGTTTFLALPYSTSYYAYAKIGNDDRWVSIRTPDPPDNVVEEIGGGGASPYLDVKADFGAVGNGVADDTTAIQAALDYVKAHGGTLFFPVGFYIVSSTLHFNTSQNHAVTLKGAGGAGFESSVLKYTANSNPLLTIWTSSGWTIENLGFLYTSGTHNGNIVEMRGGAAGGGDVLNFVMDQCCFYYGGPGDRGFATFLLMDACDIGVIKDTQFVGADKGIQIGESSFVNIVTYERLMFARLQTCSFYFVTQDCEMVTIRNCTFEASGAKILGATGNRNYKLVIDGNWFGDSSVDVTWIDGLVAQSALRTCTISDNEFGPNSNDTTTPNVKLGDPSTGTSGTATVGSWLILGNDVLNGALLSVYGTNFTSAYVSFVVISNTAVANVWEPARVPDPTVFSVYVALGNGAGTDYLPFSPAPLPATGSAFSMNVGTRAQVEKGHRSQVDRGSCAITVVKHDFDAYVYPVGGWFELQSTNLAGGGLPTIAPAAGVTLNKPAGTALAIQPGGTVRFLKIATDTWDLSGDLVQATTAFNLHSGTATHDLPSGATLVQTEQALRGLMTDLQTKGIVS